MARLIPAASVIQAAGSPPKKISEYVGRVASQNDAVSVAVMESPSGWSEPGQRPDFDEYTVVLESEEGSVSVSAGQAIHVRAGEWIRYSSPGANGARYVSVCIPAFSPETVHRDR